MTMLAANPTFIPVLRQVCSDPDGFAVLLRRPLWRALGHYVLLGMLCVVVNLAFRAVPIWNRLAHAVTVLENRYGQVVSTGTTLAPAITPETARGLSLGAIRVDYFPDVAAAKGFDPVSQREPVGLLWTPSALLVWQKFDDRRYSVLPFPVALLFPEFLVKPVLPVLVDGGEVAAHLAECTLIPASGAETGGAASVRADRHSLISFLSLGWGLFMVVVAVESALKAFFVAPSYIFMFCMVMHLFRPRGVPGPDLVGLFKLGLYAAFPGLIIAMLCSALELPFLEFHLVFSMVFLVWLFIVYGRLRRLTERPDVDEEDFA
jgi:hypothetical protein